MAFRTITNRNSTPTEGISASRALTMYSRYAARGRGTRPGTAPGSAARRCGERVQRAAVRPEPHREVVDQPGGADPGGDREQRFAAVPLGDVLERARVHQDQVVDQG